MNDTENFFSRRLAGIGIRVNGESVPVVVAEWVDDPTRPRLRRWSWRWPFTWTEAQRCIREPPEGTLALDYHSGDFGLSRSFGNGSFMMEYDYPGFRPGVDSVLMHMRWDVPDWSTGPEDSYQDVRNGIEAAERGLRED